MSDDLLFVYGTLKRGYRFHDAFLGNADRLGEARTVASYRLFDCGEYPAMVLDQDSGLTVIGEVYRVPAPVWAALDELEGVDEGWYVREPVPLLGRFAGTPVQGYRYLRSVSALRDLGALWPGSDD